MKSAPEYRCSFCHREGHYWPTCRKKARTDALLRRMVAAIIAEEVRVALLRAFPGAAALLVRTGNVALHAYAHAGGRWSQPTNVLYLPKSGRRS